MPALRFRRRINEPITNTAWRKPADNKQGDRKTLSLGSGSFGREDIPWLLTLGMSGPGVVAQLSPSDEGEDS